MREYSATINPCYHCMPLGAIFAAKGFEKTIILLHGSQGCATYMRRHLARHFHEPVDVASSSLSEKDAIYGGEGNLEKAIRNICKQYNPKMIVVASTCLSETIGDDIDAVIKEIERGSGMKDELPIISVSTPSYQGSFSQGYWKTVKSAIKRLCSLFFPPLTLTLAPSPCPLPSGERVRVRGKRKGQGEGVRCKPFVNIIPGLVTPQDLRWLHGLGELFQIDFHVLGNYADTFDAPFESSFKLMPEGGSPISYLKESADAVATIEFSVVHSVEDSPAAFLHKEFNVPAYRIPYPVGLSAVDKFMEILTMLGGEKLPDAIYADRGRLLDAMADAHKILFDKRTAIFGESEYLFSIYKTLLEWGMECPVIVYGEGESSLKDELTGEGVTLIDNGSMFELKEWLDCHEIDMLLGSSVGSSLSYELKLPLLRRGFPVHDRFGAARTLTIGYEGTISLLYDTANIFEAEVHSSFREKLKERYLTI